MKTVEQLDKETLLITDRELKYIQFTSLLNYEDRLTHCFTTRIGGVSSGECNTLNLGFNRKDTRENVKENFEKLCNALELDSSSMVFSNQVHDNKIRIVAMKDKGKGYTRESDIIGYDGLATAEKGITLVTFYADCVPVLLYDKKGRAAASVHSGWKSTLKSIAEQAVNTLKDGFEVDGRDLICVIGPSIGKCCFEVDADVYEEFAVLWPDEKYFTTTGTGKWKIDLREIIKDTLVRAGVPEENIHTSTVCTKCRRDLFFSYRGDNGKTGSLAALMHLKGVRKDSV